MLFLINNSSDSDDTAQCWQVLWYAGSRAKATKTISTLKKSDEKTATIFSKKETLIREIIFSLFFTEANLETATPGAMHREIGKEAVQKALFNQDVKKAPGVDKLNFRALRLLWDWDSGRIVALARQCFRLGVHPLQINISVPHLRGRQPRGFSSRSQTGQMTPWSRPTES